MPRSLESFENYIQANPSVITLYGKAWLKQLWLNFPVAENESEDNINQRHQSAFIAFRELAASLNVLLTNPDNLLVLQHLTQDIRQNKKEIIPLLGNLTGTEKDNLLNLSRILKDSLYKSYQSHLLDSVEIATMNSMVKKNSVNDQLSAEFKQHQQAFVSLIHDPLITLAEVKQALRYNQILEYQRLEAGRKPLVRALRNIFPIWLKGWETPTQTVLTNIIAPLGDNKVSDAKLKKTYQQFIATINNPLNQLLVKISATTSIEDKYEEEDDEPWESTVEETEATDFLDQDIAAMSGNNPPFILALINKNTLQYVNQLPKVPWFTDLAFYQLLQKLPADFFNEANIQLILNLPVPFIRNDANLAESLPALAKHPQKEAILTVINKFFDADNLQQYLNNKFTLAQLLQVDHKRLENVPIKQLSPMLKRSNTKPTEHQHAANPPAALTAQPATTSYVTQLCNYWSPPASPKPTTTPEKIAARPSELTPTANTAMQTTNAPCMVVAIFLAAFAKVCEQSPTAAILTYLVATLSGTSAKTPTK